MIQTKRIILTQEEEIANSITHGAGAVFSIVALVLLILSSMRSGNRLYLLGSTIFGSSMLFLYSSSTLCHAFSLSKSKACRVFRTLDHSAIYIFIAGTYTAFYLSTIGGSRGITILIIQWALVLIGVILRTIFYDKYVVYHVIIYVLMGWLAYFFIRTLALPVPTSSLRLLVAGGVSYTFGILFFAIRLFKYHHMVWHLFVLGGSVCHFFMIYLYVLPR